MKVHFYVIRFRSPFLAEVAINRRHPASLSVTSYKAITCRAKASPPDSFGGAPVQFR